MAAVPERPLGPHIVGERVPRQHVSVLIVDDEPDVADLLAESLRRRTYSVATAYNGREALDLLAVVRPSAIVLDIQMPVMNGAEFRQRQRQDRELLQIPTVVMTGSDAEMQLDLAVDETLRKPVRLDQLLAFLERNGVAKE